MGTRRGGRLIDIQPAAAIVPGSLGILGGTFDPIHHGHLAIAEEVREVLGLAEVWLLPARVPPHRAEPPGANPDDRARMVELAVAGNPSFRLSRIELDRDGPSYTVDTLRAIADARRGRAVPDPVFIVSGEALAGLPTWRDPAGVLARARIAVVPRAGFETPGVAWRRSAFGSGADRFVDVPGPLLPISGSVIRARAAAGRSLRYLVPEAVAQYIADHRLYGSAAPDASSPAVGSDRPANSSHSEDAAS